MIRRLGIPVAAFAVLVASGCGGGGAVQAPHVALTERPVATSATMRIVIPPRPAAAAGARRSPAYISYATQSIKIVFTPNGGGSAVTVTQNLTPTSPGCQASLSSSTTCTVQLPGLSPGTYAADFTMYDGMLDTNNAPTGNVLSANQSVPVTIHAGQSNVISVTLNGVPTAVAVLPSASSSLSGSQRTGYTLSSCFASEPPGTEGVTVVGLDADNNIIVGSGAPTPALTSSDSTVASVSTPSPTAPNAFALSGPATPATVGTSFTLTASVTPLAGSPNTAPIAANILVTFGASGCPTPTPSPTPSPTPMPSTSVSLSSNHNPSVSGQAVTFTATVSVNPPGSGTPTGTVAFADGGANISGCTAQSISSAQATCTLAALSVRSHSITATYSGDANFTGSTSTVTTQVVLKASTDTTVVTSGSPSSFGSSVTFTAVITPLSPGAGTPTGAVSFQDGGSAVSGCSAQAVGSGQATCTVSTLSVGSHSITAAYSGDANFGSSSNTVTQVVQ